MTRPESQKATAQAMLASGESNAAVERNLNLPAPTVSRWKQQLELMQSQDTREILAQVSEKRLRMAILLAAALEEGLESTVEAVSRWRVDGTKIEPADLKGVATGLAILFDKLQLILGQPTNAKYISTKVTREVSDPNRAAQISEELQRKIKQDNGDE